MELSFILFYSSLVQMKFDLFLLTSEDGAVTSWISFKMVLCIVTVPRKKNTQIKRNKQKNPTVIS